MSGLPMQRLFYRHIMTILRLTDTINPNLSTSQDWQPVTINEPCMLSAKTLDPSKQGGDVKPVSEIFKVICNLDVDLQPGDLISVDGKRYLCGEPFRYMRHQEAVLTRTDLAGKDLA